MRLEYRILWFEDRESAFESDRDALQLELEALGFILNARWEPNRIDSVDELREFKAFEPDLLFVDLNLDGQQGDELASMLREVFSFTDIVFYSQDNSEVLRSRIAERGIDGVYCMNRRNLVVDGVEVIKTTVRKAIDLNHMRGIVMATVADFDHLLDDCFRALWVRQPSDMRDKFLEEVAGKLQRDAGRDIKRVSKDFGEPGQRPELELLLANLFFNSSKKISRLIAMLKVFCDVGLPSELIDTLGEYNKEVLGPRNQLAHAVEVQRKDGTRVLQGKGKSIKSQVFGEMEMLELRKTLLKHRENLEDFLNHLADDIDVAEA